MILEEKLRQILKKKRWTQNRLAKHIGVIPSRLNNWLHGKSHPNAEWLTDKIDALYSECNR